MKCGNCGNDLMLDIVPKGPARLLRLLPMSSYRCVRCGKLNWRLSDTYGAAGSRLAITTLLLVALGGAYWLGAVYGLPGQNIQTIYRTVAVAPQAETEATQPPALADEPSVPALPQAAPKVQEAPATQAKAAETTEPETAAPEPGAQASAAIPAEPMPMPAPMPEAAAPARPGASDLDEVVVTAPPAVPQAQPKVIAANKAAKSPASKWALRLRNVTVREADGSAVVTIQANATLDAPRSFALDSPPRFVVDLPGTWDKKDVRALKASGGIVKGVRIGLRGSALRLVLDLTQAPTGPVPVAVEDDRLVITIR